MNAIELNNLTDDQFILYMNLISKIRNKYKEKEYVLDYDWGEFRDYYFRENSDWIEFKNNRTQVLEDYRDKSLNEFIVFDNEKPVAFIAYKRLSGDRYEFIYDSEFSETPGKVYEEIFEILINFFNKTGAKEISYMANRIHDITSFRNYGAEITRDILTSKLLRKDIDVEKLKCIIQSNGNVKEYNLVFYREIPEEIFERYIDYMNDVLKTKDLNSPVKTEFVRYTKERLLRGIQIDKEDGDPMYMFMLFDNGNIAGSCKVYIEKEDDGVFIQHCGGLTGVAEKYRGNGIAKYLKANMYLKIMEDFPDFRHAITDTYPWNKHMYSINEELGFKIFNEGFIFKFTKEILKNIY